MDFWDDRRESEVETDRPVSGRRPAARHGGLQVFWRRFRSGRPEVHQRRVAVLKCAKCADSHMWWSRQTDRRRIVQKLPTTYFSGRFQSISRPENGPIPV